MYGTQTFCLLYSSSRLFENDVKMYGTQTLDAVITSICRFENDVKMYGTQTLSRTQSNMLEFENDVKMYGTQTIRLSGLVGSEMCIRDRCKNVWYSNALPHAIQHVRV